MAQALRPYVVKQGDYLAKLAYIYGFDAAEAWRHEKNKPLRQQRKNPQVLYPGDILFIPTTVSRKGASVTAAASNQFVANLPTTSVILRLKRGERLVRNATCLITGLTAEQGEYHTDGEGIVRLEVAPHISLFRIAVPSHDIEYSIRIGALDPINSPMGAAKRLANLGYLASNIGGLRNDTATLISAIKVFQTVHDLDPSGELDEATTSAIKTAHGS